jgi:hypothetical protein
LTGPRHQERDELVKEGELVRRDPEEAAPSRFDAVATRCEQALKQKKKLGNVRKDGTRIETDEMIAPRTVRHVYGTLRAMLNDAVADEVIPSNPCVLKDELPEKKDKDRTWRRTAVFARDEVESIISAPPDRIPDDRRVMYVLMFLGSMRLVRAPRSSGVTTTRRPRRWESS